MSDQPIQKGDEVSWKWGSGKPSGTVDNVVKEGDISITSDKGNVIKKNASPENPAVHVAREGNDVVKRASELTVEDKANGADKSSDKTADEEAGQKETGQANGANGTNGQTAGEKRDHDEADEKDAEEKPAEKVEQPASKKQKTAAAETKKGPGRPKKTDTNGTTKKAPAKKREPKPAATADGKPRRSGRNKT